MTTTSSTSSSSVFGSNLNTFMNMLITQLQNQDPTSPMDTSTFTQQLTQFAQIEQLIDANSTLTTMSSNLTSQNTNAALGYLGKSITYDASKAVADGTGAAWTFTPTTSGTYTANVLDSSGNTVYTSQVTLTANQASTYNWTSGRNDNTAVGTGTYTLQMTNNSTNASLSPTSSGTVDTIDLSSSTQTVTVNGQTIPTSSIKTVSTSS